MWLALGLALALVRRNPRPFTLVFLAAAAGDGIAGALKAIVGSHRPRGYDPLVAVPHSHSFPSGHATIAFACATVLSALEPRLTPFFVVLAAAIAYSRLYLGVHWPLDVVAGAAIGCSVGGALLSLLARPARRERRGHSA